MSEHKNVTRRSVLGTAFGALLTGVAPASASVMRHLKGVRPNATGAPTTLTTFVLQEHSGVSSLGYKRIGIGIKPGDVPAGYRIKIQRGGVDIPADFNGARTLADGSLHFIRCCLRDTNFSANESRTYSVIAEPGSFSNTSSRNIGHVTAATNFTMLVDMITEVRGGASQSDQTASFNTHAATSTRVTKYESGGVANSYMVWGMYANGATPHAHLKAIWYVTEWLDSGGAVAGYEVCCVNSMDQWSTPNKKDLEYRATLKNGATTIQQYGGYMNSSGVRNTTLRHTYQAQWATVRLQDDHEHATRHWISATRPTLLYKPDRAYFISSGLVSPYDLNITYFSSFDKDAQTNPTNSGEYIYHAGYYQPASPAHHRGDIDGTGGYNGDTPIPAVDATCFLVQTALTTRIARVNWHAGLHVFYHNRSQRTRTRPGDGSADIANTIPSIIMNDDRGASTPSSFYDFTANGMPSPIRSQANDFLGASWSDSYIMPPWRDGLGNTDHFWGETTGDNSHAVPYPYLGCILEAEEYMCQAMYDISAWTELRVANPVSHLEGWDAFPGVPSTLWEGISANYFNNMQFRHSGRTIGVMSAGPTICPDNDPQANVLRALCDLNLKYYATVLSGYPNTPSGYPSGYPVYTNYNGTPSGGAWVISQFMSGVCSMNAFIAYERSGFLSANAKYIGDWHTNGFLASCEEGYPGIMGSYYVVNRKQMLVNWNASTNPFQNSPYLLIGNASINGATGVISLSSWFSRGHTNGDIVRKMDVDSGGFQGADITELSFGVDYYMVNTVDNTSFQLATSPGGTPITFGTNYGSSGLPVAFGVKPAVNKTVNTITDSGYGESYFMWPRLAVFQTHRYGYTRATTAIRDMVRDYCTITDAAHYPQFSLAP